MYEKSKRTFCTDVFDFCSFGVWLDLVPGERSDPARRIGIEVTCLDIADIHGTESLGAWIEEQNSYEVSVTLAARAALRVQPWLWIELAPVRSDVGVTALHSFCSICASAVAARALNPALRKALKSASIGLMAAEEAAETVLVDLPNRVASPALLAADAARAAAAASLHRGPAVDAVVGAVDAYLATKLSAKIVAEKGASFDEVTRDVHAVSADRDAIWELPLWETHRERYRAIWRTTQEAWEASGAPWNTFARIYDDFWHGREPDWDYLERIVLIAPEIWDACPEAVAEAIARIDEQLALRDALLQGKDALDQALSASSLPGIGDNQGPPLDETTALPDFVSISLSINQLTTALDEPKLERARVQSLAEKLLEMVNGARKGLLALAGLTIGGIAAAAGWDIYTTGGEQLIANLYRIAELAERVRRFALH